jgi:hypothetical protein
VVASGVANGLAYLPVKKGNTFELHRLQHFTSPAKEPSAVSLVVGVCATSLADAASYTKGAFESEAFAGADPPSLDESLATPPTPDHQGLRLPQAERP